MEQCVCLNSPIDSYGLGSGCTLKTPCLSSLRISHSKVHREMHGQKASPFTKQVSLCVEMLLFSVMPLKLQLWYPSPLLHSVFTGYLSLEFLAFLIREMEIGHHEICVPNKGDPDTGTWSR